MGRVGALLSDDGRFAESLRGISTSAVSFAESKGKMQWPSLNFTLQEPKLWYGIGILYDRYGSFDHAEEAFSSVLKMEPKFEKANEIYFRLGIIYKQQGKYESSLQCFRYIIDHPPKPLTDVDVWFQLGHVYELQKEAC